MRKIALGVLVVAGLGLGCGKYGPPVRAAQPAEEAAVPAPAAPAPAPAETPPAAEAPAP